MIMDRHLIAPEGKFLTNGELIINEIWLGTGDSPENWWEITEEEALSLQQIKPDLLNRSRDSM